MSQCLMGNRSAVRRPDPPAASPLEGGIGDRIIDAALACYGRSGVTRTTVEEIAAEAGLSRATLYRTFDGRSGVRLAVVRREAFVFLAAVEERLREARSLEDVVVAVFVDAAAARRGHAVLQMMLEAEPELVLPTVVGPESPVLRVGAAFLAPHVAAHAGDHSLATSDPLRFAEWIVRVGVSYLLDPSEHVQFGDEASVRRFVSDQFFAAGTRQPSRRDQ